MVTVTNVDFNSYLNPTSTYTGELQTGSSSKDSKAVNFFELLYSYPSKFKIKWNALDELKEDLFILYLKVKKKNIISLLLKKRISREKLSQRNL